ncbi:hypothetical protein AHMF7605_03455 [Adhaeribacter arboris]|uniref:TIR domain-containing protein n=1 Tax=Adhaeribacter arboris TaxID=2072846 RepID=A0A2T2YB29_9BACT|nr:toll/interleukin-1 receptor domain-containing protein [Adhaeribacter arboris]PSR52648.1 hypothetical protein AHMF7605_03455 [Adhaeribacter arboris]
MPPQIFISYSERDQALVKGIVAEWEAVGVRLLRKTTMRPHLPETGNWMTQVQQEDSVLLFITDNYLHRQDCLYEALEIIYHSSIKGKILLLLTETARIDNPFERLTLLDYWERRFIQIDEDTWAGDEEAILKERYPYLRIRASINTFLADINSFICIPWHEAKQGGYKPLFQRMGFDQDQVLERCIQINLFLQPKDKEIALEELAITYPTNQYVLFTLARLAQDSKNYSKARATYQRLITQHPAYVEGYYNLANLLAIYLQKYQQARRLYEQALQMDSKYAPLHCYFAQLLTEHFQEYHLAKVHYALAFELMPDCWEAHTKLAALLRDHFQDYRQAREQYELALRINYWNAEVHYNLALLLIDPFKEYEKAIKFLEQIQDTDPEYPYARYYLGLVYADHLQMYPTAKEYYDHALHLKPDFVAAHVNLATLLKDHFQKYQQARDHYELALHMEANNAAAHYHLSFLLADHFQEYEAAKQHYRQALEINLNLTQN